MNWTFNVYQSMGVGEGGDDIHWNTLLFCFNQFDWGPEFTPCLQQKGLLLRGNGKDLQQRMV